LNSEIATARILSIMHHFIKCSDNNVLTFLVNDSNAGLASSIHNNFNQTP